MRTWLHVRRTGSAGFHGISGRPGSAPWWAGILFIRAILVGVAAPVLALAGVGLGIIAVLTAQTGMGTSWRIGVDEDERTDLVTTGVFALVRNPIFTAMVVVQA